MRLLRLCSAAFIAGVAVAGALLFAIGILDQWRRFRLYHAEGTGFHDLGCGASFCDSSVFWLAGRLARQGGTGTVYHGAAFALYGAATLPGHADHWPFVYPPVTLLPAAVMSLVPLGAAYAGFTGLTIAAAVLVLRRAGIAWPSIVLGLISPAAMWSIYLGQFGLLCGALLLAGLAQLEHRPAQAGGLLGLLCVKPQYALAAPFVVLAGRHWRAMIAGVFSFVVLAGLSAGWFGIGAWAQFLGAGGDTARFLLVTPFAHGEPMLGVSVFWMLRSLGAGLAAATSVQVCVALASLLGIARLWRKAAAEPAARLLATLCLASLATPYAFSDDMAGLSFALAMNARRAAPLSNAVLAAVWLSPALTGHFLKTLGFLPEPLFIALALAVAVARLVNPPAACTAPSAAPPPGRHAAPNRGPKAMGWS